MVFLQAEDGILYYKVTGIQTCALPIYLRTTGGALRNWAVAQIQDSLAVGVLWLAGLYIVHVPWAPLWAFVAAVLQIVPHPGPLLGLLSPVLACTIGWRGWEHPLPVLNL